jgi:gas vesicle protein
MFPLRFLLGVATGAIAVLLMNPNLANRARPVAKAILKKALKAAHGAQVSGAELAGPPKTSTPRPRWRSPPRC